LNLQAQYERNMAGSELHRSQRGSQRGFATATFRISQFPLRALTAVRRVSQELTNFNGTTMRNRFVFSTFT
jgi:hypothetical protein